MSPTLSDIAKDAQTSVSTVSRVLSGGNASRRISATTRQRVIEAARRLGYRPNLLARSLRTRKSQTVALMVSDIANPWFGAMASLIEQGLRKQGYSMILVPLLHTKKALDERLPAGLPTVILDRPLSGHLASVSTDQDELTTRLCDALDDAGVKTVVLVSGPSHVSTHRRRCEVVAARFKVLDSFEGPAKHETGRAAMTKFQTLTPDAIVATNNFLGLGVLEMMRTPDERCILGCFDDIPAMHMLPVPVICANQDVSQLADGSVKLLLQRIERPDDAVDPIVVPSGIAMNHAFRRRVAVK